MRKPSRIGMGLLLAILSAGLVGCTFVIRPFPGSALVDKKIDLRVGLLIDDTAAGQVSSTSGLFMIGLVHTWKVEVGGAMLQGATATFSNMFTEVKNLKSKDQFASSDLILLITPVIQQFTIEQDLSAKLTLHCVLADRKGTALYDKTIPVTGKAQTATGCLLGVAGGQTAINETSTDAFNQAFQFLAQDILKTVDFSPYLK